MLSKTLLGYCSVIFFYWKMAVTQRYLMFISYVGASFRGSQLQVSQAFGHTLDTVQYVLENGLKHIFKLKEERPIRVALASRTDTGVHALKAALHVDLPEFDGSFITPLNLRHQLNRYFSDFKNVRVLEAYTVPDSFNVRLAVIDKTYMFRCGILKQEFFVEKTKFIPPVMEVDRTYFIGKRWEFDVRKTQEATPLFEGTNDFGAICGRPKHNTRPTVCNIKSFTLEEAQPLVPFDPVAKKFNYYNFTCRGDRFLYHMVRRMVTLTLSVGFNILNLDDIRKLLDEPVPSSWPRRTLQMVHGCGLYLVDVNIDMQKIHNSEPVVLENKTDEVSLVAES